MKRMPSVVPVAVAFGLSGGGLVVVGMAEEYRDLRVTGVLEQGSNVHATAHGAAVFGSGAVAEGAASQAFGRGAYAAGEASQAAGRDTVAGGAHAHAQNLRTVANAPQSHAGGSDVEVLAAHSNALIHARGTADAPKRTVYADTVHFDHVILFEPAQEDDRSVLTRGEADLRYASAGQGQIAESAVQPGDSVSLTQVEAGAFIAMGNAVTGEGAGAPSGLGNVASGRAALVVGGAGSVARADYASIVGGYVNTIQGAWAGHVGGGALNVVSNSMGAIVGGAYQWVSGWGGFIGGGYSNLVDGQFGAVAGGLQNRARGQNSVVGGGQINQAGGLYTCVVGGYGNQAMGHYGFVGGGLSNAILALRSFASIGGGVSNRVFGAYGTVPGGSQNSAGVASLAAGTRAIASNTACLVWADRSVMEDFASTADHQFLVRAAGGLGVNTNRPLATLHVHGTARFEGGITYLPPAGDLSMGVFTNGPAAP